MDGNYSDEDELSESLERHAKFLGIDPVADKGYLWIAREALDAELPPGWVCGEGEGEYEGLLYYHNEETGESTWDHPLDAMYRDRLRELKDKGEGQRPWRNRAEKYDAASTLAPAHNKKGGGDQLDILDIDDGDGWDLDDDANEEGGDVRRGGGDNATGATRRGTTEEDMVEDVESYRRQTILTRENSARMEASSASTPSAGSTAAVSGGALLTSKEQESGALKSAQKELDAREQESAALRESLAESRSEISKYKEKIVDMETRHKASLTEADMALVREGKRKLELQEIIDQKSDRIRELEAQIGQQADSITKREGELTAEVGRLKERLKCLEDEQEAQVERQLQLEDELSSSKLDTARQQKKAETARDAARDAIETKEKLVATEAALAELELALTTEREKSALSRAKIESQGPAMDTLKREVEKLSSELASREASFEMQKTQYQTEIAQSKARGEEWRRKVSELQSAYDSLQRESGFTRDSEVDHIREVKRAHESAEYEKKRALEKMATSEQLRAEATARAEKAERELGHASEALAMLRIELVRQKGSVEEEKRAIKTSLEEALAVGEKLRTETAELKVKHGEEIARLQAEVASNMPQVAAAAIRRAQEQLRPSIEAAVATATKEASRKIEELTGKLRLLERSGAMSDPRQRSSDRVALDILREENSNLRMQLQSALSRMQEWESAGGGPRASMKPPTTPNRRASASAERSAAQWLFPPSPIAQVQQQQQFQQQRFPPSRFSDLIIDEESAAHAQAMATLKSHIEVLQAQTRQLVQQSAMTLSSPIVALNHSTINAVDDPRVDDLLQRARMVTPMKPKTHLHWTSSILDSIGAPASDPGEDTAWESALRTRGSGSSPSSSFLGKDGGGFHTGYWKQRYMSKGESW